MIRALAPSDLVVVLDVHGILMDTAGLAERLDGWLHGGSDVAFLIGGPDGLDPRCRQMLRLSWSLSPLTLPHALARIVVAEQLYRAWSILKGHPYHRE